MAASMHDIMESPSVSDCEIAPVFSVKRFHNVSGDAESNGFPHLLHTWFDGDESRDSFSMFCDDNGLARPINVV